MKFCQKCHNMLYSIEEREKKAYLKCRSCPYEEEVSQANPVVYEHDIQQDTSVQYSINPYLKHDPTLPRFTNMVCPNEACPTQRKESDIVGISWMQQMCCGCISVQHAEPRGNNLHEVRSASVHLK